MEATNHLVMLRSRLFGVTTATIGLTALAIWLALISPAAARADAGDGSDRSFAAPANGQVLTMTVETPQTPVTPGDIVTYSIELTNPSGVTIPSVILSNTLPSGLQLAGSHGDAVWVQEVVPTVTPLRAMVRRKPVDGDIHTFLGWRGSMGDSGSVLRISYRAQVQACYDPNPLQIHNQVAVFVVGNVLSDGADLEVDCHPPVNPLLIDVSLSFKGTDEELQAIVDWSPALVPGHQSDRLGTMATNNIFVPGRQSYGLRIVAANSDTSPAVLGLVGLFPSRSVMSQPYYPATLAGYRVPHLGYDLGTPLSAPTGHLALEGLDREAVAFRLRLGAGETKTIEIPYALAVELPSGTELVNDLGYCISYDGLTCPGAVPGSTQLPPSFQWVEPVTVTVKYQDLGDAPDSSNHAAPLTMTAYSGVQANFPTVFAPTTGAVQGPVHENPRPFHLGRRVSPEAEADIGPDMDPTNNILPGFDVADRDGRDDGVRAPLTPIQQCETTMLPVRVAIRPAAVAYFKSHGDKGYLNAWIDGNHDGDWEDGIACPTGGALEHIVIDHEIHVVTLGAGLHTLAVPTRRIPWSAQGGQAAWVRVTLSELPSNKTLNTGGIDHGDGRGYATSFVLGETEDYLYRPTTDPHYGPDMEVEMSGIVHRSLKHSTGPSAKSWKSIAQNFEEIKVTFRIDLENKGELDAQDVVLTMDIPSAFVGEEKPRIVAVPEIPADRITFGSDTIMFSIPPTKPGEGLTGQSRRIFVSWTVGEDESLSSALNALSASPRFTSTVVITSSNDANLDNNTVQSAIEPEPSLPTIGLHAAESGVPPYDDMMVQRGTTCENEIQLGGRGQPSDTLAIISDGSQVGITTVAIDGSWTFSLTLPDGVHRIRAWPLVEAMDQAIPELEPLAQGALPRLVKSAFIPAETLPPVQVKVDSTLPWDPISLTFTDPEGNALHPADSIGNGSLDASGWVAQLKPSTTYVMSLRKAYDLNPNDISIKLSVGGTTIDLTDDDQDGFYQATFTTPAIPSSSRGASAPTATPYDVDLSIQIGQVESIFGGAVEAASTGIVYDVGDASPVEGAVIAAFTVVSDANKSAPATYIGLPGHDYGQTNPQTTTVDGSFDFWAPPATYRLDVSRPGYQPYRSQDIAVVGDLLHDDIGLTPVITEEADYVIAIDSDGFDPAVLSVPPGAVIQWVNVDIQDHTSTSTDPALDYPSGVGNGGWDSGVLGVGDSYLFRTEITGTFTYQDGENPSSDGIIIVDPDLAGRGDVYLPLVIRSS